MCVLLLLLCEVSHPTFVSLWKLSMVKKKKKNEWKIKSLNYIGSCVQQKRNTWLINVQTLYGQITEGWMDAVDFRWYWVPGRFLFLFAF